MKIFQLSPPLLLSRILLISAVLLLIVLSGCIVSLNPWLSDKYETQDYTIQGSWEESDGNDRWVFLADKGNGSSLLHNEDNKLAEYSVKTFEIGHWSLMQLFPKRPESLNGFNRLHLVRAYGLYLYRVNSDSLLISTMEPGILESIEKADESDLCYKEIDDRLVLTSETTDIESFLLHHITADSLWSDPSLMLKK
jgi:hypothetical protein